MPLKPETALRKMLETFERHKAMLDMLSNFVKTHPSIVRDCSIHRLHGKLGLKFDEYALAVPYQKKGGGFTLKLVKSGEDWDNGHDWDDLWGKRTAAEDISNMPDDELAKLLESVSYEADPDRDPEDEEEPA